MTQLDFAALGLIGVSALLGLSRGFVREVLGLAAWGGAAWGSYVFGPRLIPAMHRIIGGDELFASIMAYAAVFVGALIICSLGANLAGRLVRLSLIGGLDRTLGMVFGVIRGGALLIGAYILGGMAVPAEQWPVWVKSARCLPLLHDGAAAVASALPDRLRPAITPAPASRAATAEALLHATPSGSALQPAAPKPK